MRRILIVDDDPIVLRIYRDGLAHSGFQVETAEDGLAAMKTLSRIKPDLAVLDLMMPKLSGVDVLKFIRSQPDLTGLRVIVLSNSYANEIAAEATALGVDRALLKVRCSPGKLCRVIDDVFSGRSSDPQTAELLAAIHPDTLQPPPASQPPALGGVPHGASQSPSTARPRPDPPETQEEVRPRLSEEEMRRKARQELCKNGPEVCNSVKSLLALLLAAKNEAERSLRLQNLYRRVHFITSTAGLADCFEIAHLATVFEALLFDLLPKPGPLNPSLLRTIGQGVDLLAVLFDRAEEGRVPSATEAEVLVVDDDSVCNRLVVAALRVAHLRAQSVEDPRVALEYLRQHPFDLVLLDIEMPGMDGFETCRRLRQIPAHARTPVIYVTSYDDFVRSEGIAASGGGDLIGKPILPLELAFKVVLHLLRNESGPVTQ